MGKHYTSSQNTLPTPDHRGQQQSAVRHGPREVAPRNREMPPVGMASSSAAKTPVLPRQLQIRRMEEHWHAENPYYVHEADQPANDRALHRATGPGDSPVLPPAPQGMVWVLEGPNRRKPRRTITLRHISRGAYQFVISLAGREGELGLPTAPPGLTWPTDRDGPHGYAPFLRPASRAQLAHPRPAPAEGRRPQHRQVAEDTPRITRITYTPTSEEDAGGVHYRNISALDTPFWRTTDICQRDDGYENEWTIRSRILDLPHETDMSLDMIAVAVRQTTHRRTP